MSNCLRDSSSSVRLKGFNQCYFSTSSLLYAKTLIIAEHDNKQYNKNVLSTVTAASKIGGQVDILIAGSNCENVVKTSTNIKGITHVLYANHPALEHSLPENVAPLARKIQEEGHYTHILSSASTFGKNVIPRLAALLDVAPISEIISVESEDTFHRPIYAGNVIAKIQSVDKVKVLTVRTTSFDRAADQGGSGEAKQVNVDNNIDSGSAKWVKDEVVKSERPELTGARVVVSGGRALKSKENFSIIEKLADKLGGAVGASRAAVDAGYAPNDWQVGQTGKVVAPELYIAAGISGQIQHLAGMKDSKVIVAINTAADAPIFQVADYGLVADLFSAVPEMTNKL